MTERRGSEEGLQRRNVIIRRATRGESTKNTEGTIGFEIYYFWKWEELKL